MQQPTPLPTYLRPSRGLAQGLIRGSEKGRLGRRRVMIYLTGQLLLFLLLSAALGFLVGWLARSALFILSRVQHVPLHVTQEWLRTSSSDRTEWPREHLPASDDDRRG